MAELTLLKTQRAVLKSQLTRFGNFLEKLNDENPDLIELEIRLSKVEPLFQEFNEIQTKIEVITEVLPNEQELERDEFDTKYFSFISQAKRIIAAHQDKFEGPKAGSTRAGSNEEFPQPGSNVSHYYAIEQVSNQIRLPKVDLPQFDGSYDNWLFFKDTFNSIIHNNNNISEIQKFHYLRLSLKGEACEVISSLEISAKNYDIAWKLLLERYENKSILIGNHVKALFNLKSITKESHKDLRDLLDNVNKHLRALDVLGQPIKHWDTLIIYMITGKLDSSTRREWETQNTNSETCTFNDLTEFLKRKCRLLEAIQTGVSRSNENAFTKHKIKSYVSSSTTLRCIFCKGNHLIYTCEKFLNLDTKNRFSEAKRIGLCINCLRKGHSTKDCTSDMCRKCNKKHHTLLHFSLENSTTENGNSITPKTENENLPTQSNNHGSSSLSATNLLSKNARAHTLLSTAVVQVFDRKGKLHDCRVILDSGSECSFITKEACNRLQLPQDKIKFTISGINQNLTSISNQCKITVQSKHNSFKISVTCFVLPKITEDLPCFSFDRNSLDITSNIVLADPNFDKGQPIDILLGADIFWDILKIGHIKLGKNKPSLQKTHFGWVVSGRIFSYEQNSTLSSNLVTNAQLDKHIERFWELEQVDHSKLLSPEETACELHYAQTFKRNEEGRFIVRIPFKQNPDTSLGFSKEHAEKRFYGLERRLQQNPNFKEQYVQFLEEYLKLGHMSRVVSDNNSDGYFMPHHGVLREDKITTRLRVVFDASASTSNGTSLNQLQMTGPVLQNDLFSIILRFRKYIYVISADISKMYRQILIDPKERKYQKILWRSQSSDELLVYQLNTVTYGMTAASFLAVRCLVQLANECKSELPKISDIIKNDFYMDDLLSGSDSVEEASTICEQINEVLQQGCFPLRKWRSNNPCVIQNVCQNDQFSSCVNFHSIETSENEEKTLGLIWSPKSDNLSYKIKPLSLSSKVTKRSILSETAQIFDPLGLLGPCTILAKIIIQRLWQLHISWDESIPFDLNSAWLSFRKDLHLLSQVFIPRHILCSNAKRTELHGFADASESAYGACVYIRSVDSAGNISVELLCSKTRVAPLKTTTMPRLELCAALLLSQLIKKVSTSMQLNFNAIHLWTDSMIVLSWIQSPPSEWKIFVSNRVTQIQELTNVQCWNYINTKCNPADCLSRGILPKDIKDARIWWHGPDWLSRSVETWPDPKPKFISKNGYPQEVQFEMKKNRITATIATPVNVLFNKFSSFSKLQRVTAYCLRFKNNCYNRHDKLSGPLSCKELKNATLRLICLAQHEAYIKEITDINQLGSVNSKSKILSLNPFVGQDGILRVGGRLKYGNFGEQKKHPAVLPSDHPLSILIAEAEHKRLLHAGPQTVLSSLREQVWIVSGKNLVKKITRSCFQCFRHNSKNITYLMSNLPKLRITPARPFINCGLDYCGPILIRDRLTRNFKSVKAYVCIFICLVTKAIHLELVGNLTTNAFLAALRRFASRRGKCSILYSDNATNFVGACAELNAFLKAHKDEIQERLSSEGISWQFIPPRAPHFGGLWEAAVKSFKAHFKRVVGEALFSFEEISTVLTQIEACLNSRPISPLSTDPNDLNALTPSHFLIGERLTAIPDAEYIDIAENRLSRFQRLQKIIQHFWRRWSRDYLPELQVRSKWKKKEAESLSPGDLVLIKEDNAPPLKWNIGRVLETHPGRDGTIRVVTVKTARGEYKRPVAKLCLVPSDSS